MANRQERPTYYVVDGDRIVKRYRNPRLALAYLKRYGSATWQVVEARAVDDSTRGSGRDIRPAK